MLKVGMVGCGAIATELARAIRRRFSRIAKVAYLYDQDPKASKRLAKKLNFSPKILSLLDLIRRSDFIIEAASQKAVVEIVPIALKLKKKVMVMSVGGLLKLAPKTYMNSKGLLYVPSGAICGIDGLLAARQGGIKRVTITTRKSLKSLQGAPFFEKYKFDLKKIRKPTLLFEGNAALATRLFPRNVNVAATFSLAGIGPRRTKVRIVASPTYTRNTHEIEGDGSFGRLRTVTENIPSKTNPKTSALAFYSAIACMEKIFSSFKIGT